MKIFTAALFYMLLKILAVLITSTMRPTLYVSDIKSVISVCSNVVCGLHKSYTSAVGDNCVEFAVAAQRKSI